MQLFEARYICIELCEMHRTFMYIIFSALKYYFLRLLVDGIQREL